MIQSFIKQNKEREREKNSLIIGNLFAESCKLRNFYAKRVGFDD